jgi:hypothetical protein
MQPLLFSAVKAAAVEQNDSITNPAVTQAAEWLRPYAASWLARKRGLSSEKQKQLKSDRYACSANSTHDKRNMLR